jgi:predicted DNA-binding transcriptional regulator YafY
MRASRLLSIQMLLETRGRMSAQALAEELEVSLRTLYRDVDELTTAGVPIYAERGRNGGFQLMPGWKTTLTGLTASEAQAVFMIGLTGPAAQLGLEKEVADAQLKLVAALPAYQRSDAQRIQSRFHVDTLEWYKENDPVPHLGTVASAVWDEKQLALVYESWKGVVRRTVNPLGLVIKSGIWYLIAAIDDTPRTYRISSIQQASIINARCNRPKKFNLAAYWNESIQRFERDLYTSKATVLATPSGIKELKLLSAAVAKSLLPLPASQRKDGRIQLSIPIENIDHAAGQLLRLAPDVEVLEPAELKTAIIKKLRAIAKCYRPKH